MNSKLRNKMNRGIAGTLAAVLFSSAFLFVPEKVTTSSLAADANVQKYEDEISALEQKQKELEALIAQSQSEANEAANEKKYLDNLLNVIETKEAAAEKLISELEVKVAETEKNIAERETQIDVTNEKFMERMRMAHENGNASYLEILLNAESISDFLSKMERVNAMLDYDKKLKTQYKEEKAALEQEKADLSASKQLQEQTLLQLEKDAEAAKVQAEKAEQYYNTLQSNKAAYQAQYNKAKQEEQKLDAQLTAYLKSLQEQNSSQVTATGEFMWPLPVGKGYISCYYGGRDPNSAPHYALDVAIGYGTPIYASNDGTVLKAEWHYSYGYYVLIDHGNGRSTLYAHCSALHVGAGQKVTKGQTVGNVGSTGFSTGNHLHFEFRINGARQNPLNYVKKGV